MKRRGLINLGMLALVAILAIAVWLTPDETTERAPPPLTSLHPSNINRIRIANNNGPEFILERHQGEWRMTAPYQVAANTPRINILLDLVSTPSVERFPMPGGRLEEFGLDKPIAEVEFDGTLLVFGGTHPFNYRRYVRVGETLHLTNDLFPHHFLATAEAFVSHGLLQKEERITGLETADWTLSRETGGWRLEGGPGISGDRLTEKIDSWQNAWVSKVLKAPQQQPQERVGIALEGGGHLELGVIRDEKRLLLIRTDLGLAYQLPASSNLLDRPQ